MAAKDYLSATESGNIILMGCALSAIEEYISGKAYATKDEITQLKHTKTRMLNSKIARILPLLKW